MLDILKKVEKVGDNNQVLYILKKHPTLICLVGHRPQKYEDFLPYAVMSDHQHKKKNWVESLNELIKTDEIAN